MEYKFITFEGHRLRAPIGFMDSPLTASGECGPGHGMLTKLIPDSILGISIRPACKIHDYCWRHGTQGEKVEGDLTLFENAFRIVRQKSKSRVLAFIRITIISWYLYAVVYPGKDFYG